MTVPVEESSVVGMHRHTKSHTRGLHKSEINRHQQRPLEAGRGVNGTWQRQKCFQQGTAEMGTPNRRPITLSGI